MLQGPYSGLEEKTKVIAILTWLGSKAVGIYNNFQWDEIGLNKDKSEDVLKAFASYFKPSQSVLQLWFQLGNIYTNQFKTQSEFMNKLREVAGECSLTTPEEVIKLLFVIHNTNTKVRDHLIDKINHRKSAHDFLMLAKSVESMVQTENLLNKLLENAGQLPGNKPVSAVRNNSKSGSHHPAKGPKTRSASRGQKCNSCGGHHQPK